MASVFYPAIAFPSEDGSGYEFIVPDVSGCTAFGKGDLFTASQTASAVLTEHLALLDGEKLSRPQPRPFEAVRSDTTFAEDFAEGGQLVMLTAHDDAAKTRRINLTLNESDLSIIDRAARERGMTRSAFLRNAGLRSASGKHITV